MLVVRLVWAITFATASSLGLERSAIAQSDVINTSGSDDTGGSTDVINTGGSDGPRPERCGDAPPDPLWGAPDKWPEADRTWFRLAQDGYYARCVGSCGFAYCYKNPCYESESAPGCLLIGPYNEPPEVLVNEDGSPYTAGNGSAGNDGRDGGVCSPPQALPPQERARWYQEHCVAGVPSSGAGVGGDPTVGYVFGTESLPGEVNPPLLQGGATANEYDFKPGTTGEVEARGRNGIQFRTTVAVDVGGGAPSEPGVDWDGWWKKWVATMVGEIHGPTSSRYFADPGRYEVTFLYQVLPDGRVIWGTPGNNGRSAYYNEINAMTHNARAPINAPSFPPGSTRQVLRRTVTFSHNMGPAGIHLKPGPTNTRD
ncbi:MAG: hypothetical protein ACKVVP_20605 [Chloroflexota bacterium]